MLRNDGVRCCGRAVSREGHAPSVCAQETTLEVIQYTNTPCGREAVMGTMATPSTRMPHLMLLAAGLPCMSSALSWKAVSVQRRGTGPRAAATPPWWPER